MYGDDQKAPARKPRAKRVAKSNRDDRAISTQSKALVSALCALRDGDFTVRLPTSKSVRKRDPMSELALAFNELARKTEEQDWLKTNLAKFNTLMQTQKTIGDLSRVVMSELTPLVGAHHGAFFVSASDAGETVFKLIASYAYKARKSLANRFALGEGLVGQSALEKKSILLTHVPEDYIRITSGLGEATPLNVIVAPVMFEDEVCAVIELASFRAFSAIEQSFLDEVSTGIGVILTMIVLEGQAASLKASEELLRDQQEELQQINEELEEKAALLSEQNKKVEQKNREVETARHAIEEKAEQLSLSSKYKSEFLANMSHELRTPLNSLLILAKMLSDNKDQNLLPKQVDYARTIHASGTDLLNLINEVLDLSKVEAGKIEIYPSTVRLSVVEEYLERSFRPIANQRGLEFRVIHEAGVPATLVTDGQRMQQVLRNLLANALKFTETGGVEVRVSVAANDGTFTHPALVGSERVLAVSVSDTGIGIASEKHALIFEAFQQADGTTSRKYGGTGLGLSISRELARLLGGEIRVKSAPGQGSIFTFFVPIDTDVRSLLVVGHDDATRASIEEWIDDPGVVITSVSHVEDALKYLELQRFDGLVLDLGLPNRAGLELLEKLERSTQHRDLPILTYVGTELSSAEAAHLEALSETLLLQLARSSGALREEAARILHRVESSFPEETWQTPDQLVSTDAVFVGKKVMVVDDDVRNVFAITSVLESNGMSVVFAENGRDGVDVLKQNKDVSLVLMDVMMPHMDGYETMREIRKLPEFSALPIIAVTAKAMKGDREKCITAGASDYITKPVDPEKLTSLMRVWMDGP